jgi:hypothetical protein
MPSRLCFEGVTKMTTETPVILRVRCARGEVIAHHHESGESFFFRSFDQMRWKFSDRLIRRRLGLDLSVPIQFRLQ